MGLYSRLLKSFAGISKQAEAWHFRGELIGYKGVALGIAANVSIFIGIATKYIFSSVIYGLIGFNASVLILFPLAIIIVSKYWKSRMKNVVKNDDDFNWRMYLEDEYEEQVRKIEELGLDKADAGPLKIDAYKEHQKIVRLFQAEIAQRSPRLPVGSVNEMNAVLINLEDDLTAQERIRLTSLRERLKQLPAGS